MADPEFEKPRKGSATPRLASRESGLDGPDRLPGGLRPRPLLDQQELAMHPVPGERLLAGKGAALGNLVLVVGKDQVDAAGVNVEHPDPKPLLYQIEGHRRTLQVPPWTPPAERRIPGRGDLFVL